MFGFDAIKYISHQMTQPAPVIRDDTGQTVLPVIPSLYPEHGLSHQQNGKLTANDHIRMQNAYAGILNDGVWGQVPFWNFFQRTQRFWWMFDDEQNHNALANLFPDQDIDDVWSITCLEIEHFQTMHGIGHAANWGTPIQKLTRDDAYASHHSSAKYYHALRGWVCPSAYPSRNTHIDHWAKIWTTVQHELGTIDKKLEMACILQPWYTGEHDSEGKPADDALIPENTFKEFIARAIQDGCIAIGLWSSAGWNGTQPAELDKARDINARYLHWVKEAVSD